MSTSVSVITPSYNQATYLEDCIRSVLAQEYPALEYMIVDGGSTDGSREIIERYAGRLAWWVSEPDHGQAEAINKGMQRARGEIVAWLNSDDLYLPGAIAQGVAALEANPQLGLVFGDALTIDPQGRPLNRLVFGDWGLPELARFRIICQPAVFMRRSVLEQAGYLDLTYHTMLDHHLWLRMARLAPVRYIGYGSYLPLAAARHHPQAKNVAQPKRFADETLRLLDWMQSQPDLAALIAANLRQVRGGAYRLAARYLLDGGLPAQAFSQYVHALLGWPGYTLKHAHRMGYAAASIVGLGSLLDRLRAPRVLRQRQELTAQMQAMQFPAGDGSRHGLEDWPGICLDLIPES